MTRSRQWILFPVWLATVPSIIYLSWNHFPSQAIDPATFLLILAALICLALFPIQVNEIKITLDRWIVFAVFFLHGAFVEVIMMQIALVFLQWRTKSEIPPLQRFLINSTMFAVISVVSAFAFGLAGGTPGLLEYRTLVTAGILYAVVYSLMNSALLLVFSKLAGRSFRAMKKAATWDFLLTMLSLPLAISFCILAARLGNIAIFLTGIPAILILLVVQLYHKSDRLQAKLSSATEIGHELADRLMTEEVFETFIRKLRNVLEYDQAYLFDFHHQKKRTFIYSTDTGFLQNEACDFRDDPVHSFGGRIDLEEIRIYPNRKAVETLRPLEFEQTTGSVLTAPIHWKGKTEGVLMVASDRPYFFGELDKEIVQLLTGYFATAVTKAKLYEKTIEKSERCGLTKLHNLRYLLGRLDEEQVRYDNGEIGSISAIMMDIDHFKSINDTYGHQNGNDILVEFAKLLRGFAGEDRILARYGGEEFVLILPEMEKEEAILLAETIRAEVASLIFRIIPDLTENREPMDVQITLSLGVSAIPEDAKDRNHLLRNADRAMYIGGKQAGRNRVGVYGEELVGSLAAGGIKGC
ncbi:GGDEF domain domain containing protein [Bacillus sp. OxB-1]|uniref:GGDEF domain-containing protein n=1 Tax=Bacillus sp. (strain OxB-1) TaxID=98228 RepID=UPI0005820412|nr:sensor domain-containing diguanylate cyclase [Bacillus sp. OxB-1]BAQ11595.1 GGDEF domain domain containing protein [Bacillus sp. OxB-1]